MEIRVTVGRATIDPATEASPADIFRYAELSEAAIGTMFPDAKVLVRVSERDFDNIDLVGLGEDDDIDTIEDVVQETLFEVFESGQWVG